MSPVGTGVGSAVCAVICVAVCVAVCVAAGATVCVVACVGLCVTFCVGVGAGVVSNVCELEAIPTVGETNKMLDVGDAFSSLEVQLLMPSVIIKQTIKINHNYS